MKNPKKNKSIIAKILIWRVKNIKNRQFVFFLSVLTGIISGICAVFLKNFTHFVQLLLRGNFIKQYHTAFYFIFPLLGFVLVYFIITYIIRHKLSHGIPSTLFAISKKKGIMKRFQMIGSLITAPITIGFGGSVGLEGPTVATGAAISSNIAQFFHVNQTTRTLLIGCAAAGAMSSIFKAPIAAIIFAIEVFSLDLTIASMLPLLAASVSAVITSRFFFGSDILLPFSIEDSFTLKDLPLYILLGVATAFVSIYFSQVYERIQNYFDRIDSALKRILIGGLGIGVLVYFIPPLYGEGFAVINNLVLGNPEKALEHNFLNLDLSNTWMVIALLAGLVFFKVIASALTFGAGGVGGIFAPTLFMGSILGNCMAKIINTIALFTKPVSESNFTLVGMAGLMAGVLHAPLTAIFLIAELTGGYELFIPLMITSAIAFSITRYFTPHSVYAMELGRKGELITHNKDHAVLTLMDRSKVIETNFVKVYPDMNLGDIVHHAVIKSNRNIFPVVDRESKELLGIIPLDNIRSIMFDQSMYTQVTALDVMHSPIAIIDLEEDKMTTIMRKFQDSSAWNLPVIRHGVYAGFISKSKLLTVYRRKLIEVTK